jgi:MFS family permease
VAAGLAIPGRARALRHARHAAPRQAGAVGNGNFPTSPSSGSRLGDLVATDRFVLLYTAQLLVSLVAFVPFAHLVLFATAEGWTVATGVYLISLIGLGGLGGRILIGFAADRLGSCRTASLCVVVMALSLLALPQLRNKWELCYDAALYGLGYGGVIGLNGPMIAEVLGVSRICRSVGCISTSWALGILVGPWAVGALASRLGRYDLPFQICAAFAMLAAVLLYILHYRVAVGAGRITGILTRANNEEKVSV